MNIQNLSLSQLNDDSLNNIIKQANLVIKKCCPECLDRPQPTPVDKILQGGLESFNGTEYDVLEIASYDDLAFYDKNMSTIILDVRIYEKMIEQNFFARYVVAHEIGHAVLHNKETSEFKEFRYVENEANTFAFFLLAPMFSFEELFTRGMSLQVMSEIFDVSINIIESIFNCYVGNNMTKLMPCFEYMKSSLYKTHCFVSNILK